MQNGMFMDYEDKIIQCKSLDELFELWRNKEPEGIINHRDNTFIADGIVNIDEWNKADKKILYVLKEAYGDGWDNSTLASWINDGGCLEHKIWRRLARWTYGIYNTDINSQAKFKKDISYDEAMTYLKRIAVLNIKKSKGKSYSKYEEINTYGKFDKIEIKKEIELINPDIIVCGYTFYTLYNYVFEFENDLENIRNDNWHYYLNVLNKQRLFIDYYHPANHWPELMNYYGVVSIYQQSLIETFEC